MSCNRETVTGNLEEGIRKWGVLERNKGSYFFRKRVKISDELFLVHIKKSRLVHNITVNITVILSRRV